MLLAHRQGGRAKGERSSDEMGNREEEEQQYGIDEHCQYVRYRQSAGHAESATSPTPLGIRDGS